MALYLVAMQFLHTRGGTPPKRCGTVFAASLRNDRVFFNIYTFLSKPLKPGRRDQVGYVSTIADGGIDTVAHLGHTGDRAERREL